MHDELLLTTGFTEATHLLAFCDRGRSLELKQVEINRNVKLKYAEMCAVSEYKCGAKVGRTVELN